MTVSRSALRLPSEGGSETNGFSAAPPLPLAIDLYCGLGGWTDGLLSGGWDVIGFDIERHQYGAKKYPAQFVLQDVLTLHGAQFANADVIVASPPCQEFSYRAMPWKRAKALPPPYLGMQLFWACFRIQAEACEAAGRYIPMVVENVCGAQRWVGDARWHFGSYYLWGDIPALMPQPGVVRKGRSNFHFFENTGLPSPSFHGAEHEASVQRYVGIKTVGHVNKRDGFGHTRHLTNQRESEAVKNGGDWFSSGEGMSLQRRQSSKSAGRKAASAEIARIPFPLAQYIARVFRPEEVGSGRRNQQGSVSCSSAAINNSIEEEMIIDTPTI